MRTRQVEAWVFRRKNGKTEYLLLRRIPKKGEFWQSPTGGIEAEDKDSIEAGFREIKEEAGIGKEEIINVLPDIHSFIFSNDYLTGELMPHSITTNVHAYEVGDVAVDISHNIYPEHDSFKWVSFEEAMRMLKWQNNKDALTKLHARLANGR